MGTWDWQIFLQDTGGGETYLHWMMSAWGWTLSVALLSLAVALGIGVVMGIFRTTPRKPLLYIGNAWTELFRNVPLLVQLFLWYHVLPALIPPLRSTPARSRPLAVTTSSWHPGPGRSTWTTSSAAATS